MSRWTTLVLVAGFAACVDDGVAPRPDDATPPAQPRVIGFAELTFSGIGTPDLASSLLVAPTLEALESLRAQHERSGDLRDVVAPDLTFPADSNGAGNGTMQLRLDESAQFVFDSVRYMHATYFVRNAQSDGTAYNTDRTNLTFLAVSTSNTVNQTAVRHLLLDGGTPAPDSLALHVLPTDLLEPFGNSVTAVHPDVLQILRESEVAAAGLTPPAGVTSMFPYGFVVLNPANPTTRTLPASPDTGSFTGRVDFAFSIPQQPATADDPQTISVLMLAVDDSETRLTQGLQEQTAVARFPLEELTRLLGADTVTLLPGGSLSTVAGLRTLCSVRTAGPAGAATAHLVNVPDSAFQSFTPDPYATDGSANDLFSTADFQATFSAAVQGAGPNSFTVRGLQSGPQFIGQNYSGNGTTMITTPTGTFFPGEEIEIALTNALACPRPYVARYRVQTGLATGTFIRDTAYSFGTGPTSVAIGDLNGDGSPDLAVANLPTDSVYVLLNDGAGSYQPPQPYDVGDSPSSVAIGDFDGVNGLDLAVANSDSHNVSVLLNTGSGTFPTANSPTYPTGNSPGSVEIGDLNGDGSLDLVVANEASNGVSVLVNNGNGTFPTSDNPTYPTGNSPGSVAIGDLNGDGSLDLAVANQDDGNVSVLLNNGDGAFPTANNPTYAAGNSPAAVAIADLNGDGSLDLATANENSDDVSVLLNGGNGTFPAQNPTYAAGDGPTAVAIGDLDGIGGLDIATANFSSGDVSVLLNHGNGTFPTSNNPTYASGFGPHSVAIGDLTGSGILGLAVANAFSGNVVVFRGQP